MSSTENELDVQSNPKRIKTDESTDDNISELSTKAPSNREYVTEAECGIRHYIIDGEPTQGIFKHR